MVSRGHKAIPIRWVDVNKGDRRSYNVRSRLVGKELRAKTKETLLAHELFSAMPPWEMIKVLLSGLVTDGIAPGMELEVELPEKEFPDQEHDYGVDMVLLPDEQLAEESQVPLDDL